MTNVYLQHFKGNFKVNSNLGPLGQVNIRDLSSKLICILVLSGPWFRNGDNIKDYQNCQNNLIGGSFQVKCMPIQ